MVDLRPGRIAWERLMVLVVGLQVMLWFSENAGGDLSFVCWTNFDEIYALMPSIFLKACRNDLCW